MKFATPISGRKFSLVNGMHTVMAFMTLERDYNKGCAVLNLTFVKT